ncbi:hypothetical protein [Kineococcus sp. SYSU DK002]|uniref:hypothetical protein n=1 Tax=Kineococcus sp. SYSU DK002 TaxID=3383123 RepID=UPI003D7CDDA6
MRFRRIASGVVAAAAAVGLTTAGAAAGAQDCLRGTVAARYAQLGGEQGPLGPVTACERATASRSGSFATFRSGVVYQSPATGAWDVSGSFLGLWRSHGHENGFLGYPRSGEVWTNGGVVQQAYDGGDLYWSSRTAGAGPHSISGAFRGLYADQGGVYGRLGLPLTQEIAGVGRGVHQNYEHGVAYWTAATGAHSVTGAFLGLYRAAGWERGRLGYPSTQEVAIRDGGVYQNYQGGVMYWTAATGAHVLTGPVLQAYASVQYENGPLGYPTSQEYPVAGGTRTDFQHGYVSWTPREGWFVVLAGPGTVPR